MQIVDAVDCRSCEHCRGLCIDPQSRELFLRCAAQQEPSGDGGGALSIPHTPLSEIMSAPVRCVPHDADLHTVLALFERHGIGAAPVVDARGHALGIVTKTDLVRCLQEREDAAHDPPVPGAAHASCVEHENTTHVREIMSHVVFSLQAEASVDRAAALMAYEGVHHLVITASDGRAAGIVSSLDILRWLARHSGYVVPHS